MLQHVSAVIFFVPDVHEAAAWYARVIERVPRFPVEQFAILDVGGVELSFHLASERMPPGTAGQVAYWEVPDLDAARARFEAHGATWFRGPVPIENGRFMGQLRDPFGNLVGLMGPHVEASPREGDA